MTSEKIDLDSKENIKHFIECFYDKVLADNVLAHIFTDVAGIDIKVHIPIIRSYWEKLLLGDTAYQRHTMNIHRNIHQKFPLSNVEFERWLSLFKTTLQEECSGPKSERAGQIASNIAFNMDTSLNKNE